MVGGYFGSGVSRREFLRYLGAAAGAAGGMSVLHDLRGQDNSPRRLRVVIVGAGLAGLVAAYELEKRGHSIVVLEADRQHVGGRVRTLRFEEGLYGEAGAMRIPTRHEVTRHYCRELGISLRKFIHSNPEAYFYVRGRRERVKDVKKLAGLYALSDVEKTQSPDDWWAAVATARVGKMTPQEREDLSKDAPETEAIRQLDQLSLQQLLEQSGLSQEAIEFLAVTYGQETEMPTAATEHLREELKEFWTQGFDEVVGGTDRIASAFAERLRNKPKMGCEVVALAQDAQRGKAAAVFTEGGQERREEGDFILCTVPLPVLQRIRIDPALSGEKQRAIRELNYDSATKVLAVCNRRFWESEDAIFGGGTYTDLPSGCTYYPSDNAEPRDPRVSAGPGVMLASYTWGMHARRLASLAHRERSDVVLKHLAAVHPQLAREGTVRRTASWSWDTHPFSGGAFAWFLPGQHTNLHRHVIAPEGRIHFAGEHTSLAHTWMQGALESGVRAVTAIMAASE